MGNLSEDRNLINKIKTVHQGLKTRRFRQWSQQLLSISCLSLYAAMTLEAGSSIGAPVTQLNDWRFYPEAGKLEFTLSTSTKPQYFYLSQPPRLVIDLPDTKLGRIATKKNYTGAVQSIRISQLNATVTRIVLDLADGTVLDPQQVKLQPVSRSKPTRWVLRPFAAGYSRSLPPKKPVSAVNKLPPNPYNYYPQPPNNPPPSNNYLQLPSTLPAITNTQQPYIIVPPLNPRNPAHIQGSTLPPANFPSQPVANPNFPIPTVRSITNYPTDEAPIPVIEFGQPLPKLR